MHDILGTPDKADFEFKRWQMDQGHRITELEAELRSVKNDADQFKWIGKRMQVVLEKLKDYLLKTTQNEETEPSVFLLLLAIDVVNGKAADWNNVLKTWFVK